MLLTPVGKILVRLWSKLLSRLSGKLFITRQLGAGCMEVWDLRGYSLPHDTRFIFHTAYESYDMISCAPGLYFTHDLSTTRIRGTGDWSRYAGGIGIRAALRFLQPTRFPGDLYLFYGMFNYFLSLEIHIPVLTCKIQLEWSDQPM